jgi:hypothetical protein
MAAANSLSLPKPWPDFLKEIEAQLSQPVKLHCLGGFVPTALYGIPRFTADLDYIDAAPATAADELEKIAGRASTLGKKYKLFVQNVGIADLPENYESRLQELNVDLKKLKLWALGPYDLLLAKVTRNSPKDQEDAKYLIAKMKLDFKTFYDRWEKS